MRLSRLWKFAPYALAGAFATTLLAEPKVDPEDSPPEHTVSSVPEGRRVWEEFGNRIDAGRKISPLGPNLFGDQINLANGALSFSVTDVSIPGNSALPVAFGRSFSVGNRKDAVNDSPLADWHVDLPNITGTFAPDWVGSTPGAPGRRCSVSTKAAARPPGTPYWDIEIESYWQGNTLQIPGVGGGELLLVDANTPRPSTGGPYYWIAGEFSLVSCLPTIRNGSGEGFLVTTPDGTRYWFDWMAQFFEPPLRSMDGGVVQRRRNALYATRVEDRFGNWVQYTYTNAWNTPVRLTRIQSNDGRQIDVNYNTTGQVASVVAGQRTWQYQYAGANTALRRLTAVIQPDASRWSIDFAAFS